MRLLLTLLITGWLALPVQAQGIAQVLVQSQQQRLALRPPLADADARSEAAQRVRDSFARLQTLLPQAADVALQLVGGAVHAEALFNRAAVVASVAVGDLPEGERLLMLAHELGHLQLGHWQALRALYLHHIPGEVSPQATDPVAGRLGADAHALSHRHEFQADAFGFEVVRRLGFGLDTAWGLLTLRGLEADSATHPGTRRRLAQLRALDARLAHELTSPAHLAEPAAWAAAPPQR